MPGRKRDCIKTLVYNTPWKEERVCLIPVPETNRTAKMLKIPKKKMRKEKDIQLTTFKIEKTSFA